MKHIERQKHWEAIYQTKKLTEVSWFQPSPATSIEFIKYFALEKTARIIDIGGGDSLLVDNLLAMGFENITVLDISETALKRAKKRLGRRAKNVKWIVADAAAFEPTETYDFWHDRAAFHFLTNESEITNYISSLKKGLKLNGVLVLGTFSELGPKKCSGIEIKQYSEEEMTHKFEPFLEKIKCIEVTHKTPSEASQDFIFCSFKKV